MSTSSRESIRAPAQSAETPRLSTADQTMSAREYSMIVAAFPMEGSQCNIAIDYLLAATMNCVNLLPVLSGVLECSRSGFLKLFIPRGDHERTSYNYFRVFRHLWSSFPHSYKDLQAQGFSDALFRHPNLFPFPAKPSLEKDSSEEYTPVFSVQANFISGGLLLVVAIYRGIIDPMWHKTILNVLFSWAPEESCQKIPKTLVYRVKELEHAITEIVNSTDQSKLLESCPELIVVEDRNSHPYRTLSTIALAFAHQQLEAIIFHARRLDVHDLLERVQAAVEKSDKVRPISIKDILATFVWSHITKARRKSPVTPINSEDSIEQKWSNIYFPKSFCHCVEPMHCMDYFGNATVMVPIKMSVAQLITACDVDASDDGFKMFVHIAKAMRDILSGVGCDYVRKRLALGKSLSDPRKIKAKFDPMQDIDVHWNSMENLALDINWNIYGTGQHKPTVTRQGAPDCANGVCYMMPTDTLLSKDMYEILVPLNKGAMEMLEALDSWKAKMQRAAHPVS